MRTHGRRRAWKSALVAALVGGGLSVLVAVPAARAEIASISPAVREVDPGGSTSAFVTVQPQGATCLFARPSHAELQPTFARDCDGGTERWSTTLTVQVPETPGTYSVRVTDDESGDAGGKTFTVRVRPPPPPPTDPPPPPPTTTTTARPTTTRPPTTTTAPPPLPTEAPPAETTTSLEETTTTAAPLPGDAFEPLADLLEEPLPEEGLFLPLLGEGYRSCLPLTAACGDDASALVLIPARSTEVEWQPLEPQAALPAPRSDLRGLPPIPAVGVEPESPRAQNYVLPILDLTAAGGQLRALVRSLDDRGDLVFALKDQPLYAPVPQGPSVAVEPATTAGGTPFGRPTVVRGSSFTEAAPALAVFASSSPQLVYGVRADVAWGLNLELVPLLGESVPFLVRGVDGPPGLFVSRPAGLRVATTRDEEPEPAPSEGDGEGGGPPAIAWLGIAVGAGAVATAIVGLRRKRPAFQDLDDFDDS